MAFNPFNEKGIPVEKQFEPWSELNVQPYEKLSVHPYTRSRIILMNGIEVESALFLHHFSRHNDDMWLKQRLAMLRRIEQQQQKIANWLIPSDETGLEITIGYEQLAVDLTATLARTEPDPYIRQALDFALIEDFDHLYRYANVLDMQIPGRPEQIVGDLTEIMPGRPTVTEHRHPFDEVRKHYDSQKAHPLTKLHVMTITAAEQQTMNFYMNVGNRTTDMMGRGLYMEIAQIEEQHVSHYGSLADPRMSWFECLALHDYNECYLYYSCMESEPDPRIKKIWSKMMEMEIGHLQIDRELMQKYEKRDPAELFPASFPELTILQPNKDYVRKILETQTDLTTRDTEFVPMSKLPNNDRCFEYQKIVNGGEYVPSETVIGQHIREKKHDYRLETQGQHPVQEFQNRQNVLPSRHRSK